MKIFCLFSLLLFLAVTSFAQRPKQVFGKDITGKLFQYENFPSKFADRRNINVWLPTDYSTKKRYAVLYMHDGQNLFNPKDSVSGVEWGVDEVLSRLMKEKKVKDTIVVGIWSTVKRVIEFSPRKPFDMVYKRKLQSVQSINKRSADSDKYLKFIVTELKPFIDRNYSTKPDQANTIIMGSSMGGLMSIYAIGEYPKTFGAAGCISTQFQLGRGVILNYMREFIPKPKNHRFYFDYSQTELDPHYETYQWQANNIMKEKGYTAGLNWAINKFNGEYHNEESWSKRIDIPLMFLLN